MTSDGEQGPRGPAKGGRETGHLDICQPLMKEFNLVENLKQPCLTGGLTDFSSLCWHVAAVSMREKRTWAEHYVILEGTSADMCQSGPLPWSPTLRMPCIHTPPGGEIELTPYFHSLFHSGLNEHQYTIQANITW